MLKSQLTGRNALFLGNFGFAKVIIYLAPLLLAYFTSSEIYGAIEFSQSLGLLIISFSAGIPLAGLNQRYLVNGDRNIGDLFYLLTMAFSLLTIILTAIGWVLEWPAIPLLVIASISSALLHNVIATWFRMIGARNRIAWADGTATLLAGLLVLLVIISPSDMSIRALTGAYVALNFLITLISGALWSRHRRPAAFGRLRQMFMIGLPMTIVGGLAIWLGIGGRIIIGFISAKDVAVYGVAFRIAGLALGIHQLAVTALFAKLYRSRTRFADPVFSLFLSAVALLCLLLSASGPVIIYFVDFESLDSYGRELFAAVLPATACHTLLWIGYAMLQMRINRFRLAGQAIIPTIAVTVVGIAVIFAVSFFVGYDIVLVSWMITVHAAIFFLVNYLILAKNGIPHRRVGAVTFVGAVIIAICSSFLPDYTASALERFT